MELAYANLDALQYELVNKLPNRSSTMDYYLMQLTIMQKKKKLLPGLAQILQNIINGILLSILVITN